MRNVSVGLQVFRSRGNGERILNVLNCRPQVGRTTGHGELGGWIVADVLGEEEERRGGGGVVVVMEKASEGEEVVVGDGVVSIWPGNGS